ncbi:MAG TPA: sigma 54-interacting transcriptional regulator [Acidiferrobacterales bacterium]
MATTNRLTAADRDDLRGSARIIYGNPFSEPQGAADGRRHAAADGNSQHKHFLSALIPDLQARIADWERRGLGSLERAGGEDRELLRYAFLFEIYHGSLDELDGLIQDQLREDESLPVPFAGRVLARLKTRGFADGEALHYLALFYQLRRAYYFIARSLVGDSACMRRLRRELWDSVFSYDVRHYDRHLWNRMEDFSTLLLGETGTGKGAAAAAIGRSAFIPFDRRSQRFAASFTRTFIATNLSQFSAGLVESELFGHRKGAFTGAIDDHQGLFGLCSAHGALFLDEIGDIGVPVQIKLLRVLQERSYTPVGGHQPRRFAGRVITATNRRLDELRRRGEFRDDLFYRLCSNMITVPPLRQRIRESGGELGQLAGTLLQRLTGEDDPAFAGRVLDDLQAGLPPDYAWPGNVRELEQALRRVLLTRRYAGEAPTAATGDTEAWLYRLRDGDLDAKGLMSGYCALLYRRHGTYEEVARRTGLDRRTVKKYLDD